MIKILVPSHRAINKENLIKMIKVTFCELYQGSVVIDPQSPKSKCIFYQKTVILCQYNSFSLIESNTVLLLFVPKKIAETVIIHAVQLSVFIFSVKWESNF